MKKVQQKLLFSLATAVALSSLSGLAVSKGKSEAQNKPERFVRIALEVNDQKAINKVVLGQLKECKKLCPQHRVKPFSPMVKSGSEKGILFINGYGETFADYHGIKGNDSWGITVLGAPGSEVKLEWDASALESSREKSRITYVETPFDSKMWKRIRIIDLETLDVYEMPEDGSLTVKFGSQESSRNFRVVLGPIKADYFDPASGAIKHIKENQPEVLRQRRGVKKGGKFGLPPG